MGIAGLKPVNCEGCGHGAEHHEVHIAGLQRRYVGIRAELTNKELMDPSGWTARCLRDSCECGLWITGNGTKATEDEEEE